MIAKNTKSDGDAELVCQEVMAWWREAREVITAHGDGKLCLRDQWQQSGLRWIGDHWTSGNSGLNDGLTREGAGVSAGISTTEDGLHRLTINRTQTGIISGLSVQHERPTVVRLKPQESMDEPDYFLRPVKSREMLALANATSEDQVFYFAHDAESMVELAKMAQAGQVEVTGFSRYQLAGLAPLRADQAQAVQAIMPGIVLVEFTLAQMRGEEPFGKFEADTLMRAAGVLDNELYRINDRAVTEVGQRMFDNRTGLAGLEFFLVQNGVNCAIFGHQPFVVQWNREKHIPVFCNPNILNVGIDPNATRIEDADYVLVDSVIDAEKAKVRWPKHAKAIEEAAQTGQVPDVHGERGSDFGRQYERQMLTVTTAWRRHAKYPMTEDEAVSAGLVSRIEPAEAVLGEDGTIVQEAVAGGYVLTETNMPVDPASDQWPKASQVRQIQVLPENQIVLSDQRCPWSDIPIGWNVNIPIPYLPYGQGEPVRLEDLQQAVNRLLSILHNHARYYQFPMMLWPRSLVALMEKSGVSAYAKPGRMVPVDDAIWMQLVVNGGRGLTLQPPPVPPSYVELLRLLLGEIDRMGGNVGVMQGEAPNSNASGTMVAQLQQAAKGPLGFKARHAQWMLEHVARVTLDAIVKWVPESVWAEVCNQYPWPVLRHIRQRIKPEMFDVEVEIVTGGGVVKEIEKAESRELYKDGLLDRRTTMERCGVADPEAVERRINQEQGQAAPAMAGSGSRPQPAGVPR